MAVLLLNVSCIAGLGVWVSHWSASSNSKICTLVCQLVLEVLMFLILRQQSSDHLKFTLTEKSFCLAVPTSVLKNVAASLDAGLDEARQVRSNSFV